MLAQCMCRYQCRRRDECLHFLTTSKAKFDNTLGNPDVNGCCMFKQRETQMSMDIITIDFETYYDKDFSLSKMMTAEYVLSPQFQVIGIGIKLNDKPARWIPNHNDAVRKVLAAIDFSKYLVLCHNTMFDGAILAWHYGVRPRMWLDTLSMARPIYGVSVGGSLAKLAVACNVGVKGTEVVNALGKRLEHFTPNELARYGDYCVNDTEITWKIFQLLLPQLPVKELALIDSTLRMYIEPTLQLDTTTLQAHLDNVRLRRAAVLAALPAAFVRGKLQQEKIDLSYDEERALASAGTGWGDLPPEAAAVATQLLGDGEIPEAIRSLLMSNAKFAAILESCGVEPPTKISPTTGKVTYAFGKTDKQFTALLEHDHPLVSALVAARLGTRSTIEETRTRHFLTLAGLGRGLPVPLQYSGANQTWRWSGGDKTNVQNLPRGGALRKAIVAPDGYAIVAVDSSNIELRVNHTFAGQSSSVESFKLGRDLYCEFASVLFNRTITKADKHERQLGKLCIAEGELVLTDRGLVPIEQVTTVHRVWDGVEWVTHDGAVLVGEKEVMTYDGLTATPDHVVYLQDGRPCELRVAAAASSRIAQTGAGGQAVRLGDDFDERAAQGKSSHQGLVPVSGVQHREVGELGQPYAWEDDGVSGVLTTQAVTSVADQPSERDAATLHQPEGSVVQELRGAWDRVSVCGCVGGMSVGAAALGAGPHDGAGPDRQQRTLRSGESSLGDASSEQQQQAQLGSTTGVRATDQTPGSPLRGQHTTHATDEASADGTAGGGALEPAVVQAKRRVWDILNAGPRHRFTVSGRLVSNCHLSLGYGCGYEKFREICRLNKVTLSEEEARNIVDLWRNTYAKIPEMWKRAGDSLNAIYNGVSMNLDQAGLVRTSKRGLELPEGRFILYPDLQQQTSPDTGRLEWVFKSRNGPKRVYGGAVVENICQSLARHIIADQWYATIKAMAKLGFPGWRVVLQVHDELVLCGPVDSAPAVRDLVTTIMGRSPQWWPDVPLAAEGDYARSYGECK